MDKFICFFRNILFTYVNDLERDFNSFVYSVSKGLYQKDQVINRTLYFMNQNLATCNLWLEYKYKGYKYLKYSTREKMYENLVDIEKEFDSFFSDKIDDIKKNTSIIISSYSVYTKNWSEITIQQFRVLVAIANFINSNRINYVYQKSTNFGELLKKPNEIIKGDCNQILTLYTHLFSRKYKIENLELKLLPEHICIHFNGIDLETTNGKFVVYRESQKTEPIYELFSVNMLDIDDHRLSRKEISQSFLLESAKLADMLSTDKKITSQNLVIAYKKVSMHKLKEKNITDSIKYARLSNDKDFLENIVIKSVDIMIQKNRFLDAEKIAKIIDDINVNKYIINKKAEYYFKNKDYNKAIELFRKNGDKDNISICYINMFNDLQKKISHIKNITYLKTKRDTIRQMEQLAKKSEKKELIDYVNKIKEQIK